MANTHYTISFNEKELRLLLNALGKRPFEEVYEVIEKIVAATTPPEKAGGKNKSPLRAK